MILNCYIPENDSRLINQIKLISAQKKRSFSYIVREALEMYLYASSSSPKAEDPTKRR